MTNNPYQVGIGFTYGEIGYYLRTEIKTLEPLHMGCPAYCQACIDVPKYISFRISKAMLTT